MASWRDLIFYALIREAFTDEVGKLRLKCSSPAIRSMVEENRFLRHIYRFPYYMDAADITRLAAEDSIEFNKFVENLKPLHLVGRFQKTGRHSGVIVQNGQQIPLTITRETRFEKNIEHSEAVHVFGEKDEERTVKAVISDELYQTIGLYCGLWERLGRIEDYLLLDGDTQMAISRIMCDRSGARSLLLFLAYTVSRSVAGNDLSSDKAIKTASDEFNRAYVPLLGCGQIDYDELHSGLTIMQLRDSFLPHISLTWATDAFTIFLVVIAIINDISPWSYPGKSAATVLAEIIPSTWIQTISEYLPLLCERDRYFDMMNEILANSKTQVYEISNYEDLLFEALTVSEFEQPFILKAINILFESSIAEYQVTDIVRLMSGPNGSIARKYIFDCFNKHFQEGEAAYHFAAAAILNADSVAGNTDPLTEAVGQFLCGASEAEQLLGVTRISLIVWTQGTQMVNESVIQKLLENLRSYDSFYSVTASVVHDLIISGSISPNVINEKSIFQTAVMTLTEGDGKLWAERLLAVMPWDPHRVLPPEASNLVGRYLAQFERELRREEGTFEPEVSFGCLLHLGCWREKKLDRNAAFQQLLRFYRNGADTTQRCRMRLLQEQIGKE